MPSRFSSEETRRDARLLAGSLGTEFRELPIGEGAWVALVVRAGRTEQPQPAGPISGYRTF